METCEYRHVNTGIRENSGSEVDNLLHRAFRRQLLVSSIIWMCFFIDGLYMGAPTVFIPQLRREANSTEAVSEEMASWLSAVLFYARLPWAVILPIVAGYFGRKIPMIVICVNTFAASIMFYMSSTVTQILISEVMESITGALNMTVAIMMLAEYTSPKYRGFFLTFKSATIFWGIWVSNAIGTFFYWKYIGIVMLVCSLYALTVALFIPESPYWLASEGHVAKCIQSHRWLKGKDDNSEMELARLISSHRAYLNSAGSEPMSLSRVGAIFCKREFYKPTLLCMLIICFYSFTGKLACSFYSLDIIKKMTSSETAAYSGMLILDGVTVFGMYVGSGLSRCVRRRILLFVSSIIGIMFLFILSIYVYLTKKSFIEENHYVSVLLLMCYSLSLCCGPLILASSIYGELLPLRHRSFSVCIIIIIDELCLGTIIKLTPYVIRQFGLEVAFFFFGLSSAVCVVILYKYLPETKDKTLQEIADTMVAAEPKACREEDE